MTKYISCLFVLFLLQSCIYGPDDNIVYEPLYTPVTQSRSEFEKTLELQEPRQVMNAGKIYIKNDLIYLNEVGEGFHIIDNSDPEDPEPLAFLKIPLSTDLAIRDKTIYVHHAVDLVSLTYSISANKLTVLHRERNVFPVLRSPDGLDGSQYDIPENHIVIGYKMKN